MARTKSRANAQVSYDQTVAFENMVPFTVPVGAGMIPNLIAEQVGSLTEGDIATVFALAGKADASHTHAEYIEKTNAVLPVHPGAADSSLAIATTKWVRDRVDEAVLASGAGDMAKTTYDTDNDGVVDKAEGLWDGATLYVPADLARLATGNIFTSQTQIIQAGTAAEDAVWVFKDSDSTARGQVGKIRSDTGNEGIRLANLVSNEAIVLKDTGGLYLKTGASLKKVWSEADLTPVNKAGDTMTGTLSIQKGLAGSNTELLTLVPTDYGANRPKLIFKTGANPDMFVITLWDGMDTGGTILFGAADVQVGSGNSVWHSGNLDPAAYATADHSHSAYLSTSTGGTMTGTPVLANAVQLQGVTTGAANKQLLVLNGSDQVEVGDTTLPLILNASAHPTIKVGASTYTMWHSGNLNPSDYALASHAHASATTSTAGFMSAADKTKLDGIAANANNYTHPATHPATIISVSGFTGILSGATTSQEALSILDAHNHDGDYAPVSHAHTTKRVAVIFVGGAIASTGIQEPKLKIPFVGTITNIQYRCGSGSGTITVTNAGSTVVSGKSVTTTWDSATPAGAATVASGNELAVNVTATSSMENMTVEITIETTE